MRIIDRLIKYLDHHRITPYNFERACGVANGYLKKQTKGRGSIGSEILEKIVERYKDLSLTWLITGKGNMLLEGNYQSSIQSGNWSEDEVKYPSNEYVISLLRDKIAVLESALSDKEKIIKLLETQLTKEN